MIRLALRCPADLADRVLAELVKLAPGGVEEEREADYVEFAIYGAPGELPDLPDLRAVAGDRTIEISTEEIPDDWADRWRDFHRPVVVGERIVVRPSWGDEASPAEIDVVIDPGRAFGTGGHATTRMCLELLLELADRGGSGGSLVDLGTGSGVLAIAAAKFGFSPVLGCDHERSALDAAAANARANRVEIELRRVDLRREPAPVADAVTANLTGPILHEVAGRLGPPPGRLVCSGLLRREADEIAAAFAVRGLTEVDRRAEGEWSALLLER